MSKETKPEKTEITEADVVAAAETIRKASETAFENETLTEIILKVSDPAEADLAVMDVLDAVGVKPRTFVAENGEGERFRVCLYDAEMFSMARVAKGMADRNEADNPVVAFLDLNTARLAKQEG